MNILTFKFTKASGREQHTTLDRVQYITPISDDERSKMAERYGKDTSGYNCSIKFFDTKHPMLAAETLDDFKRGGVALVDIGQSQYVPAATLGIVESFAPSDAAELETKYGRPLKANFRSRVNTTARQSYLSVREPADINQAKVVALAEAEAVSSPSTE